MVHFCKAESFVYESFGCHEGVRRAEREREGWGSRRWGKLPILFGLSSCLKERVMTGRSAGKKNPPWKHTASCRDGGFLESSDEKKYTPNTNGLFFHSLPLPSLPSLPFSRVAGLQQETQHQLPRLGWVRGVCIRACVSVSVCEISIKLSQTNAM